VLARHPGAFHVRLDGPPERRAHRGALWEGIDLRAARARLIETDEARARYTRRLYQHDPADPTLYHVVLDVTVLSAAVCVELVAAAAEAFWGNDDARLEETMRETRASLDSLTHNPVDGR
jgi:cytidylate kinase